MTQDKRILIIGAGPAGLAMAGRLRQQGLPFELLEKSAAVGPLWRQHYDRLCLHTVKEHSHLPGLPFPEHYPRYVSRQQLVDYFEAYAQAFDIRPHFGQEVRAIDKEGAQWVVHTAAGQVFRAADVVIATGVNRLPQRPDFPGEANFQGRILHSREYKNSAPFRGQKVLVVGMGNTGAEIALDLSENGIAAAISVRGPVNIVPRDFLGRPTQKTAFALAKLPTWLGDWIGARVQRLAFGDLRPYGLDQPALPPARQLRETGKTPVIDLGTVRHIKAGKIKVHPQIQSFGARHIRFADGQEAEFDAVILATGYRAQLEDFLTPAEGFFNADGLPADCIGSGPYAGLYFLGFDNYKPGGILGIIYQESERIAHALAQREGIAAS
jgi:cation diffusion facilitator CzcD-associated flavoprotein CzcO